MKPLRTLPLFLRRLLAGLLLSAAPSVFAAPDIAISVSGSNMTDGGTYNFGSSPIGSPVTRTVTIRNLGDVQLTGISIRKEGTGASQFNNTAISQTVVLPLGTITFNITFIPALATQISAKFLISSSDPDENPFDLNVNGTGLASPDIAISQGGFGMTDGVSTVNFGKVNLGITSVRQFSIRNAGTASLSLSSVSASGTFTTTQPTLTTLAPGQSTSITVSFAPTVEFTYTGTLRVSSNDPDESPFDIALTGTGAFPNFNVQSPPGTTLYDGGDILTLNAPVNVSLSRQIMVTNATFGTLTGIAVTVDGDGAADYTITTPLPASLAPAESATFVISFRPLALGTQTAALHIHCDQDPADPFDTYLSGSGVELPADGDEDQDGVNNMLETATGSDPLTPGPQPGVLVKNGDSLELTFYRRISSLGDTALTVEWADDPNGIWTTLDNSAAFLLGDDGTLQEIRYTAPAGTGARFMRIRATKIL